MPVLRVGIALSGGVDSTVAAALLLEQGFSVYGFFMQLPLPHFERQRRKVQQVAQDLAIPLYQIDLRRQFTDKVIRYFTQTYLTGQTPNPCVQCNCLLKFGILSQIMHTQGMDKVATGHYAQIHHSNQGITLARGRDLQKDQSYFLAGLSSEQLALTLFPLGTWTKKDVYQYAENLGFRFHGEESQDVCFLSQGMPAFLAEQNIADQPGPLVDKKGKVLGMHKGVWNYTIGQRRGIGIADAAPWYVISLDARKNSVTIGKKEDLFQNYCLVRHPHWMNSAPAFPWSGLVQLRSRHIPAQARLEPAGGNYWRLSFDKAQRAITPGQFAVFYEKDLVIGSAVIDSSPSHQSEEDS